MNYYMEPKEEVAKFVANRLIDLLGSGKKVLWLLSGGSGGQICVEASRLLAGRDLSGLFVTMSDERYGEVGHQDENMQILLDAGMSLPGAVLYRPLQGKSMDQTVADFASWLESVNKQVDYRLAVVGIGEDGHICGIKPGSSAVDSRELVDGFVGDDFQRITVTPVFLELLDEAVVQAYGASKHSVVDRLLQSEGDKKSFPALSVLEIPKTSLFSDFADNEV